MSIDWKNAVAVITGAGSGIGRAAAISFAARGTKVIVTESILTVRPRWRLRSPTRLWRCTAMCPGSKTLRRYEMLRYSTSAELISS